MVKTVAQLQDIDSSLETRLPAIVQLSKVAAPYTTIVNRANVTDFSKDLLPRFGIDRVMIQQIVEVQGEVGPSGQRVWKPVNDVHDAVRFAGVWTTSTNISGQYIGSGSGAANADFVEITFYGTALNLLMITGNTNSRTVAVSVDGGSSSSVQWDIAANSSVLTNRNYSSNNVIPIVSGLTLGLHTVKIQQNNGTNFFVLGYEVVNTNSTLQLVPGTVFSGGQRRYASALTTTAYNSGFESGTLGTRGGHVLVYQKENGAIAKAVTPTNTSAAYLASADHTNEEVARVYHWREFGAGRTDDFSSLTASGASDRAFTLDDGTTTLVGRSVVTATSETCAIAVDNTGFLTFTFVGTGLDMTWVTGATGTNGAANAFEVFVNGTSVGNWDTVATSGIYTKKKIVSGLPYGTHTVKIQRNVASFWSLTIKDFIVYAPKKPTLPSGAVALADYFVMADYVNDSSSPPTALTASQGILRKMPLREMVYSGTWSVDTIAPSVASAGYQLFTSVATTDYVEYTFFGTGFNFRTQGTGGGALSWTLSLNGPANTNWSSYTSSISSGGTATWNSATGVLSVPTSAPKATLFVSGLPLGRHIVRITKTSGAFPSYVDAFDVITPIHAPKLNGPFVVQNTLAIGSCAVGDLRNFGEQQIPPQKVVAQAVGISTSQTNAVTTSPGIPFVDMSVTIKSKGAMYSISGYVSARNDTINNGIIIGIMINGEQKISTFDRVFGANLSIQISAQYIQYLPEGYHKIDFYWYTGANTASINDNGRLLLVTEV